MHAEAVRGRLGARLAFTRLSFPYYTSDASLAYVLAAVHLLAGEGSKLLPDYRFDPDTGLWEHRGRVAGDNRLAAMLDAPPPAFGRAPESVLASQLEAAKEIVRTAGERRNTSLVPIRPAASSSNGTGGSRCPTRQVHRSPSGLELHVDAEPLLAAAVDENEVRAAAGLTMVIGAVAFGYA